MTYKLVFEKRALKEWEKLDATVRTQFKSKLAERLEHPHVSANRLRQFQDCYKIKLRSLGYRLIYHVRDDTVEVLVLAVARRDQVYEMLAERIAILSRKLSAKHLEDL